MECAESGKEKDEVNMTYCRFHLCNTGFLSSGTKDANTVGRLFCEVTLMF